MKEILEDTKKQLKQLSQFFHLKYFKWLEYFNKKSNAAKVGVSGFLSAIIFVFIYFTVIKYSSENSGGYWNFIILIVSSPVAFVIWHFRDENSRQQIENQRKDINLKEFQKLSEWVSGAHLPEIKIVEKSITKSSFTPNNESAVSPKKQITEQTEECSKEYGQKPDTAHSNTFSKWDGAIALQISAIYNLLPFFRGDYGESFRLPAFNLLKSAWQAMQQNYLIQLNPEDGELDGDERDQIIDALQRNANSPIADALTYVLLSFDRKNEQLNLHYFPEMRSSLCLAGANFYSLMKTTKSKNLSGMDLSEINLCGAYLHLTDLSGANLFKANLSEADLFNANLFNAVLSKANLTNANLSKAYLTNADLSEAYLTNADLSEADLTNADLSDARLFNVDLRGCSFQPNRLWRNKTIEGAKITRTDFYTRIYPSWKHKNDLEWENLTEPEQNEAMQKFCNETDMIIFDDDGNEVAKRQS